MNTIKNFLLGLALIVLSPILLPLLVMYLLYEAICGVGYLVGERIEDVMEDRRKMKRARDKSNG